MIAQADVSRAREVRDHDRVTLLDRGLALALILMVALRIGLGLVAVFAVHLAPRAGVVYGNWEELVIRGGEPWSEFLSTWQRWDALWYQRIAENGYDASDGTTHFFPLYPLLSRIVSVATGGHVVWAELIVSSVAFVAAMWLLFKLARLDAEPTIGPGAGSGARARERASKRAWVPYLTVLTTAFFPTAFFLLAPYTESLFLALTLAMFWLARTDHPWAAGTAAFFASLTRPQGAFLILPLAYEHLRQRNLVPWLRGEAGSRPGVAAVALSFPVVGAVIATVLLPNLVGAGGSALDVASSWGYQVVPPWETLSASWAHILAGGAHGNPPEIEALNLLSLLAFSLLALIAVRRLPLAYALYTLPSLALLLTRQTWFSPQAGTSRYVLVLFPCFMLLALWLARKPWLAIGWLAVSVSLEVVLLQFWARWGFVA